MNSADQDGVARVNPGPSPRGRKIWDWPGWNTISALATLGAFLGLIGALYQTNQSLDLARQANKLAADQARTAERGAAEADLRAERAVAAFEGSVEAQRSRLVVSFVDRMRPDADNTITIGLKNTGHGAAIAIAVRYDVRVGAQLVKPTYPMRFHIGAPATISPGEERRISALTQFPDKRTMQGLAARRHRWLYLSALVSYTDQFGRAHAEESSFMWAPRLDDWIPCDREGCDAKLAER